MNTALLADGGDTGIPLVSGSVWTIAVAAIPVLITLYKMTSVGYFAERMEDLQKVARALEDRKDQPEYDEQKIKEVFHSYRSTVNTATAVARLGWIKTMGVMMVFAVGLVGILVFSAWFNIPAWIVFIVYVLVGGVGIFGMIGVLHFGDKKKRSETDYLNDEKYRAEFDKFRGHSTDGSPEDDGAQGSTEQK